MRLLAGALALTMAAAGAGTGVAGARTGQPGPAGQPGQPARPSPASHVLTLVTGDRVAVDRNADGRYAITVQPAERAGWDPSFQSVEYGDQLYVIPSDAAPLVDGVLDRELFNVTKLAESGYHDGVPVIVDYHRAPGAPASRNGVSGLAGATKLTVLTSIDAVAATVEPGGRWWAQLNQDGQGSSTGRTGSAPAASRTLAAAGVDRVWLDQQVEATLDASAPLVGAPQAWDAGYDGAGVTVAVLDTGVDADHPDLAGQVVGQANFSSSDTADDRHGHGTHVAGTVAGTGEASDGQYTGIAPGARLLNGKVLGDSGSGSTTQIIAGMEWAAGQGADVISMSLGGAPSDGSDPLSQAVNRLTATEDVLFVIAAGNSGGSGDHSVTAPGSADAALTVGSVTKDEQLAGSSGRGPRRGDFAIKPDITAPGVSIIAARADGTLLGPPVGDHYTQISGTSMATPHVAGAAAILLQQRPDLGAAEVKAALAGTAVPNGGLDVYQQGGGRLDIPAALDSPVLATPVPVDLGYFLYPHGDARPASAEVGYTNVTGEPVTVELSLAVRSREGRVPGPDMLSVSPATLTVAPGESATATVTVDPSTGDYGLYGGYLVAAVDGGVAARTPVGFHKEPERYDIVVRGTTRDGQPAGGISNVTILDVENMARFFRPGIGIVNGEARVRVPPGTYSVLGAVYGYDEHGTIVQDTTFLGDPEVTVTGDVTVEFDARKGSQITVETPDHETRPQGDVSFGYWRTAAQPGPLFGTVYVGRATWDYYAAATDPVSLGGFEFYSRWRMAAPEAELEVTAPVRLAVEPSMMRQAPGVDGDRRLPLLDVGYGTAADYAGLDASDAVVLARRGPLSFTEQEALAAEAGAAAMVVANDVPGRLPAVLDDRGNIPAMTVTKADGDALFDLLAGGPVTVRLHGTAWSLYLYDLVLLEPDQLPSEFDYVVDRDQLATLRVGYHNDVADHEMGESRHFSRPYHSSWSLLHPVITGPRERTEYLIAGDGMGYHQTVYGELPFEARLTELPATYRPGQRYDKTWFGQVVRPALLPDVARTTRTGDTMTMNIYEWVDSGGNYFPELFGLSPYPGDTIQARLYRDGQLVAEAAKPRGSFPMGADPAEYRIELDVTRDADWWLRSTATRTAWTFDSARPAAGTEELPLLSVDYGVDVDLANTLAAPRDRHGAPTVDLQVSHQPGVDVPVTAARLWVSYDDGDTWRSRPVRAMGDGRYQAVLPARYPPGVDHISLRVTATDAGGNRIEQEVIRAFAVG